MHEISAEGSIMINKMITTTILLGIVYGLPQIMAGIDVVSNLPFLALCVVMYAAALTQPKYDPLDANPPQEDNYTSRQIVWTVYATQLIGALEMTFFRAPASTQWDVYSTIGLLMAVSGLAFRAWAVYQLGRFFTWHVTVQEGQNVITSGPFRFVRHPSYTGALFLYVGALVMINAWYAAACALVFMTLAFVRRINTEEKYLREQLGQPYVDYSKSVKMIIPYVW